MAALDRFQAVASLATPNGPVSYYRLGRLTEAGIGEVDRLPFSVKVILENMLRRCDGETVTDDDVAALARWKPTENPEIELAYLPSRVLLQDFTGIPVVADLAALRAEFARQGGDPERVNPSVSVDLVIDHSIQVDVFGVPDALELNIERDYERNRERYTFLRWAQGAFRNFRVVPPGAGIVHQVNLEFLASVVHTDRSNGATFAFPDTLVGTDSHTTMVNGLGVLGWGVGGIEAEAAMLSQPLPLLLPEVVGVRLTGALSEGVTATDLVLTITEMLRAHGVVGRFVEFCGPGLDELPLADRATIANMAPEYGATCGFFPVDAETLAYLRLTGRDEEHVDLVERYCRAQGLFREVTTPDPVFTELLTLDLASVVPSMAGPRRPQDRVALSAVRRSLREAFADRFPELDTDAPARFDEEGGTADEAQTPTGVEAEADPAARPTEIAVGGERERLAHGSVAIAAITSCTNTSNPSVMIAAGLLARNAVERGLSVPAYVKTSLAPGSRAVMDYLDAAGLTRPLQELRFYLAGYGCTTCIGNSGPLPDEVVRAVEEENLVVAAVLSGNRNFEGRIHPLVRASYLASPPLVVAYALAGTVDIDLTTEPLGRGSDGRFVYLRDIWPSARDVRATIERAVSPATFRTSYDRVFEGDDRWRGLPVPVGGALYDWDDDSTYLREPPFVAALAPEPPALRDIAGARVLVMLGDSVTTDHISPAGSIAKDSPAARYLVGHGVEQRDFNSYGSRRGNHEVMMRGTFANVRLRNEMVPGVEGGYTRHLPDGEQMAIYDAAMRYTDEGVPLIIVAGKEYGSGSSRDWAAKGVALQGVRAVIAESYERIHRSNLIGMGVLPLQFVAGESRQTLGLTGDEEYDLEGIADLSPRGRVRVSARAADGGTRSFEAIVRVDSPLELEQYRNGGILPLILRRMR